jgi:hypothetical protein
MMDDDWNENLSPAARHIYFLIASRFYGFYLRLILQLLRFTASTSFLRTYEMGGNMHMNILNVGLDALAIPLCLKTAGVLYKSRSRWHLEPRHYLLCNRLSGCLGERVDLFLVIVLLGLLYSSSWRQRRTCV